VGIAPRSTHQTLFRSGGFSVLKYLEPRRTSVHELDEMPDANNRAFVDVVLNSFRVQFRRIFFNAQNPTGTTSG